MDYNTQQHISFPPYPNLDPQQQQQQFAQGQAPQYNYPPNPVPNNYQGNQGYPPQPAYNQPIHQQQPFYVPQQQQHASFPPQGQYGSKPGGSQRALFDDVGGAFGNQFMASMEDSPIGQIVGSTILRGGSKYVNKNMERFMTLEPLKYYFNVNNSFVANKVKLLLCPFIHKSWKRRIVRNGEVDEHLPPRDDINAPDLYIPTMAFVTYILIIGLVQGLNSRFSPEGLTVTGSTAMAFLLVEVFLVKSGFYLLNSGNVPILDILAYCGYKFVGLVVNTVVGILFPSIALYAVTITTGIFMAVFMVRTLRLALITEPSTMIDFKEGAMRRNYFLLGVAAMQIVFMYFLGAKH